MANGDQKPALTEAQLVHDLEVVAKAQYGVSGVSDATRRGLRALPLLVRLTDAAEDDDHVFGEALRETLIDALRLNPAMWRSSATCLYGLDPEADVKASYSARLELAADAAGFDRRGYTRDLKKEGAPRVTQTHQATAKKLLRLDAGDLPTLPAYDAEAWTLDDVQAALPRLRITDYFTCTPHQPLRDELSRALGSAYNVLALAHDTRTFIAPTPALTLRRRILDPEDMLYVLSRRDETLGIRQDPGWEAYRAWMGDMVQDDPAMKEGINHVRVLVRTGHRRPDGSADELYDFHRPGTLFTIAAEHMRGKHDTLADFHFGFVVSTRHEFALISAPPLVNPSFHLKSQEGLAPIRDYLTRCENTINDTSVERLEGPMQAIVTTDPTTVHTLRAAFERLRDDDNTQLLKA